MPTIHREGGFRVIIWPNDHRPPHVHVFSADGVAVIELDPVTVREIYEMRDRDVVRVLDIVQRNRAAFQKEWRRVHG